MCVWGIRDRLARAAPLPQVHARSFAVVGAMSREEYLQLRRGWNEQRTARGICRRCPNAVERFTACTDCRRKDAAARARRRAA